MSLTDRRAGVPHPRPARHLLPALTEEQDAALLALVHQRALTGQQARLVHEALTEAAQPTTGARHWFAKVTGYLGGALLLGGAALLMGAGWDELTRPARAALLAATTVGLVVAGLAISGGPAALLDRADDGPGGRRRLTGALFALASGTAALTAGVLSTGRPWLAAGAVGLVAAGMGYALVPGAFTVLAVEAFGVVVAISLVAEFGRATPLRVAGAMVASAAALALLTEAGRLVPRDLALGVAAAVALIGAQQPLAQAGTAPWAYGLTFAVGLACFALYWLRESSAVLVVGVLAAAVAVPEALWDLSNGTIGGAAVLLVTGACLLAISALGLRMWHDRNVRYRGPFGPVGAAHGPTKVRVRTGSGSYGKGAAP
jgi:hypothetical protein